MKLDIGKRSIKFVAIWFAALVLLPASAQALDEPYFGHSLPGAHAFALTAGPDGNVWFVGPGSGGSDLVIGKVTPGGEVTQYPRPSIAYAYSITTGPDGNLWFVEWGGAAIGRITPAGEITSFQLPDRNSRPTAIAAGPDGNLWFTDGAESGIGRITPSGEIAEFALPPDRHPGAIAAGPDGSLWFTERAGDRVGRITTSGHITEFPIPGPEVKPGAIVAGPDGNLWFTQGEAKRIGRITPRGAIAQFDIPTRTGAHAIVSGPEGRLWFAAGDLVGAITPDGAISWPACLVQGCPEPPAALGVGPEGDLWVGTGYQTCSLCGGQSTFNLRLRPGGIGRYELPPVKVALGPRATPIRKGATGLLLVCGLHGGCRGELRVTKREWIRGRPHRRVLGRAPYSLSQGEARRVPVPLFRKALEEIRGWPRGSYFVQADAGPPGATEARQGGIVLAFPRGAG
jgi:streptogramin lyase